ncbi:MAG: hypothetical protein KDB84_03545 [Flavobacteriales bacterium]|nr:hypothetical protein [Flavobacteriales bacterium]
MRRHGVVRRIAYTACGLLVFLVLFAHPFFAITRPSGGHILVAEGWMHREGLIEARDLYRKGGYAHLYLTGTIRPFAYYLTEGERIQLHFGSPITERIEVSAGGLPSTRWSLITGNDTLISVQASANATSHGIELNGLPVRDLRFEVHGQEPSPPGTAIAFIGSLRVDGAEAHAVANIGLVGTDGSITPGWPTHAEEARAILLEEGMKEEELTAIPTIHFTGGKTFSSARTFVRYAEQNDLGPFDVATLAVHARRTWKGYVVANGGPEGVGIIALYDPWCQRWWWWLNPYGWYQVVKELLALPTTLASGAGP